MHMSVTGMAMPDRRRRPEGGHDARIVRRLPVTDVKRDPCNGTGPVTVERNRQTERAPLPGDVTVFRVSYRVFSASPIPLWISGRIVLGSS